MRNLFLWLVSFILLACTNGDGQTLLNPAEFENKMQTEPGILLDVRTPEEFLSNHLEKAINLDIYSPQLDNELNKLNKTKNYYLYCHRGGRATSVAKKLQKLGFKKVYELKGGISNWETKGMPLAKNNEPKPKGITKEEYALLIKSQSIVLVDFSAKWCGPCRKLSPELEQMGKKRTKDLKVIMIDVDDNPEIAQLQNINELPTLLWYKKGIQSLRMIGYYDQKYMNETLNDLVKN